MKTCKLLDEMDRPDWGDELINRWANISSWSMGEFSILCYGIDPDEIIHGLNERIRVIRSSRRDSPLTECIANSGVYQSIGRALQDGIVEKSISGFINTKSAAAWVKESGLFPAFPRQILNKRLQSSAIDEDDFDLPRTLRLMITAYREYWSDVSHDNAAIHPSNPDVADWLKGQGLSPNQATNAASLIRPEWATTGRKRGI